MLQNDAVLGSAGTKSTLACQELSLSYKARHWGADSCTSAWPSQLGGLSMLDSAAHSPLHCAGAFKMGQLVAQRSMPVEDSRMEIYRMYKWMSMSLSVSLKTATDGVTVICCCQRLFCSCRTQTLWDTLRTATVGKETLHQIQWSSMYFFHFTIQQFNSQIIFLWILPENSSHIITE